MARNNDNGWLMKRLSLKQIKNVIDTFETKEIVLGQSNDFYNSEQTMEVVKMSKGDIYRKFKEKLGEKS
jgi:hypothetical protein